MNLLPKKFGIRVSFFISSIRFFCPFFSQVTQSQISVQQQMMGDGGLRVFSFVIAFIRFAVCILSFSYFSPHPNHPSSHNIFSFVSLLPFFLTRNIYSPSFLLLIFFIFVILAFIVFHSSHPLSPGLSVRSRARRLAIPAPPAAAAHTPSAAQSGCAKQTELILLTLLFSCFILFLYSCHLSLLFALLLLTLLFLLCLSSFL